MNYYVSVASQPNIAASDVAAQLQAVAYDCLDLDDLLEECGRVEGSLEGSDVKEVLDLWPGNNRVQIISYPGRAGQLTVEVKAEGVVEEQIARAYCRLMIARMHSVMMEVCFSAG